MAHRSREQHGERPGQHDADDRSEESANETFAEKKTGHLGLGGAAGAEDSDFMATPDHRGGEAVVDEINPHDHRDEAQRGEVELKRGEHPLGFTTPAGGRPDHGIGRCDAAEFFDERFKIEGIFRRHLDRGEAALKTQELLGPAHIHRRKAWVRGHPDIVGFQFKNRADGFRDAGGVNAERGLSFSRHGEDIGFAEPLLEIEVAATGRGEFEDAHLRSGEGIDAENPQILARFLRQGGDALHERRGGGDALGFLHRWKNPLGQVAANFEMRPAGY